jgi:hypothetical protein
VDTSVFCELLRVPGFCQSPVETAGEFRKRLENDERFLLPMTTILETGNHIGQLPDGRVRRDIAARFVESVRQAVEGKLPFVVTPLPDASALLGWLHEFLDWAGRGSGFGDLSILKDWERQCELHPMRRVYIWSKDEHLRAYDQRR